VEAFHCWQSQQQTVSRRALLDTQGQTAAAAAADSSSSREQYNYQQLRELAAEYIREHK
jgi:hypothetical protein